jgi:hypothetical protein
MTESSRNQGLLICVGTTALGLLFLVGILEESYWALAIPVAVLVSFVLGLAFWVGWTIATIEVEPDPTSSEPPSLPPAQGDTTTSQDTRSQRSA